MPRGNVVRHQQTHIGDAMGWARVLVLHGARQSGKTTLARAVAAQLGGRYVSMDDSQMRAAADGDPHTLVRTGPFPLVVDEVQLAGQRLVREIKLAVDDDPSPGRFLLTGSTNFLTVPTISESLAGRAIIMRLWPLSQAELAGAAWDATDGAPSPLEQMFEGTFSAPAALSSPATRNEYLQLVCSGGYPEALPLGRRARQRWFQSYVETVTSRDVSALGDLRRLPLLHRLLQLVAANTSAEVNLANWCNHLGADRSTITSYLGWLQTVFLTHELPAWIRNLASRPVRRPKIHLTDSGLAASLLGLDAHALRPPTATATGALLETFVVAEIAKMVEVSDMSVRLHHYRDKAKREVDLIIERADGALVAIEVKATASPQARDHKHLAAFRDMVDDIDPGAFRAGVLFHTADSGVSLGDRLHSAPIETLWHPTP